MNPVNGKIECDETTLVDPIRFNPIDGVIRKLAGREIGSGKLLLIKQLIKLILSSKLDDECVSMRLDAIVGGVRSQLAQTPASVVLHHWSLQPRDVMASYFHYIGKFDWMQTAFDEFDTTERACP